MTKLDKLFFRKQNFLKKIKQNWYDGIYDDVGMQELVEMSYNDLANQENSLKNRIHKLANSKVDLCFKEILKIALWTR